MRNCYLKVNCINIKWSVQKKCNECKTIWYVIEAAGIPLRVGVHYTHLSRGKIMDFNAVCLLPDWLFTSKQKLGGRCIFGWEVWSIQKGKYCYSKFPNQDSENLVRNRILRKWSKYWLIHTTVFSEFCEKKRSILWVVFFYLLSLKNIFQSLWSFLVRKFWKHIIKC